MATKAMSKATGHEDRFRLATLALRLAVVFMLYLVGSGPVTRWFPALADKIYVPLNSLADSKTLGEPLRAWLSLWGVSPPILIWPAVPSNESPKLRAEIEKLRATLRRETYDQSIENLLTNQNQFRTVTLEDGIAYGITMLKDILASRRAVKVLQALEELPREKRVERCKELFDRVMLAQKAFYELRFELDKKSEPSSQRPVNPESPLCLALLATAETGRRDILAEQFDRLDEFQKYVERRMRNSDEPYEERFIWLRTKHCIPDELFLVNVLRIAALNEPDGNKELLNQVESYCHSVGMVSRELVTVPWTARTTPFEYVGSPPDMSQGTRTYFLCTWQDNTMPFKKRSTILQEVRRIVLKSPEPGAQL